MYNNLDFWSTTNTVLCLGVFAFLPISYKIFSNLKAKQKAKKYKKIAKQARQNRDSNIRNTFIPPCNISEQLQTKILSSSLKEVKSLLDSQQITSEQLLNFYAKRMHTIGWEHKLITESNYEQALKLAKQKDQLRKSKPELCKGELFGLVMTIKDTFDLKGLASTIGCTAKLQDIPQENGLTAQLFLNAGAIIYAKTNIPQLAMAMESINEIWGIAENPWNRKRSCGGSSGGSAGSIASKSSPLCFGSDIGGSIRVPSSFNGITGLKPTSKRVTNNGHCFFSPATLGQITINNSVGPLSKNVDDCALAMEAYLNKNNYKNIKLSVQDLYLNIKPWDTQEYLYNRKMKIGYYKSLEIFPAAQAIQRGVDEAIQALKKRGHMLIEIKPPSIQQIFNNFLKIMVSDSAQSYTEILKGEESLSLYHELQGLCSFPKIFKNILSKFLAIIGQKRLSATVKMVHGCDSYEYRNATYENQQLKTLYIQMMEEQQLDAIICPPFGTVSGEHYFTNGFLFPFLYSGMYNVLDFPAGVVPVTVVQENEQIYEDGINDAVTKIGKTVMKNSAGMPINVQVISYPLQEETVMNVMKQIETEVQFQKNHPLNI